MSNDPVFSYNLGFATHTGLEKEVNEDHYCAEAREDEQGNEMGLISLSDGVGGFSLGEIASKIAINQMEKFFKLGEFQQMYDEAEFMEPPRVIQELYTRVNHVIMTLMEKENRQVGCTLVSGFFRGNDIYIANVGNSRAYLVRKGAIKQITREPDPTQSAMVNKVSNDETLKGVKDRAYQNALGSSVMIKADVTHLTAKEGDIIIFCTDGLYSQVEDMEIMKTTREHPMMQEVADALVEKANQAGGSDNVTVVCIKIDQTRAGIGDFMSGYRDKSGRLPLPLIAVVLILLVFFLLGTGLLVKKFYIDPRTPPESPPYGTNTNPLTNVNSYNSLTLQTLVPIRTVDVNREIMNFTGDNKTFSFDEDVNEVTITPDLKDIKPPLYKMTLSGAYRNFSVIQGKKNKVIIDADNVTVHLTYGSQADYVIEHHRTGDIFVLRVNNLASPFTVKMEFQENILAIMEHDYRDPEAKKDPVAPESSPGMEPAPSTNPEGIIEVPGKTPGEKLDFKLE